MCRRFEVNKVRKKIVEIFAIILIVVGVLMVLSPIFHELFVKQTVESTSRAFEHINHRQIKENLKRETEFRYEEIEDVSMLTSFESYVSDLSENVVGKVIIPSLNIDLPILKGVTNRNLNAGATTMRPDQEMGQGNYPLAGHIMKNKSLLFGALMDIQIGATVYITDKETVYEYVVKNTEVVPDTALYMIEDGEMEKYDHPIVSLMTCYHSSKTGKRFFAVGEFQRSFGINEAVEIKEYEDVEEKSNE